MTIKEFLDTLERIYTYGDYTQKVGFLEILLDESSGTYITPYGLVVTRLFPANDGSDEPTVVIASLTKPCLSLEISGREVQLNLGRIKNENMRIQNAHKQDFLNALRFITTLNFKGNEQLKIKLTVIWTNIQVALGQN